MGDPKEDASLAPLRKTLEALKEIRSTLTPFLRLLKVDDVNIAKASGTPSSKMKKRRHLSESNDEEDGTASTISRPLDPHRRAEAEAAVALAIGTLRYMGGRLRGLDQGRQKGDPLRKELDKLRGMLVSLRKIEKEENEKPSVTSATNESEGETETDSSSNNNAKRRKIVDVNGSERMKKGALGDCDKKK